MPDFTYTVVFDGGSLGNPGAGYGSYAITGPGGYQVHEQLKYPEASVTNNQAEYRTLINALDRLALDLGPQAATAQVAVRGDSLLVVNQVQGKWKVKHDGLRPLVEEAKRQLARFGACDIAWHDRRNSVRILGH